MLSWLLRLLLVRTRLRSASRQALPALLLVVLVLRPAPGSSVMVVRLVHAPHPTLTLLLDRSPLLSIWVILWVWIELRSRLWLSTLKKKGEMSLGVRILNRRLQAQSLLHTLLLMALGL